MIGRRLYTIIEAAEYLGLNPDTLKDNRYRERIGLKCIRMGRAVRFSKDALEAFVDRKLAEAEITAETD